MASETTSDLDREIARKLRRRWWKGPLLLSGVLTAACALSALMVKDWSSQYFFISLASFSGTLALFSLVILLSRLLDVSPVKNIWIKYDGLTVSHYSKTGTGAVTEKEWHIPLSTNTLFYEPGREGTMLRNSIITVPHPDDFAAWFRVLRAAEAEMKRKLITNMPLHRVLPPAPTPVAAPTLESATCRVCGETMEPDRPLVSCHKCQTPHHKDCWAYIGKCSVLHCGETNYTETHKA